MIFAFAGFLRVSNLAPRTAGDFDATRHTLLRDVNVTSEGVIIYIKWTKTIQEDTNPPIVILPRVPGSQLCPVRVWEKYLNSIKSFPLTPEAPLLNFASPHSGMVTQSHLRNALEITLLAAGHPKDHVTLHALRRGGVSHVYHAGVPLEHLKKHGLWSINSVSIGLYLASLPLHHSLVAEHFRNTLM